MQLTDIIKPECVKVPLNSTDKQGAINELINLLADLGRLTDVDSARRSVWQRENTRSTGIGHGLAIPHGKTSCCDRLLMAIGRTDEPIEFDAIDGKPVRLIFLLLSPPDQTGPHIKILARISRLMSQEDIREQAINAKSADALFGLIADREKAVVQ
ncbi:MAG: PTS sugar transporter subunit IIA [Phycisphaera sp.]|nr:PTS sugar transporter subunit IIA [Phycisphaera sp.]